MMYGMDITLHNGLKAWVRIDSNFTTHVVKKVTVN